MVPASKMFIKMLRGERMKKGLLIIISGPSGVGKGTIRSYFMNDESLKLAYSISMTTRSPRVGEKDGVDYIFTTKEAFEEAIKNGELLEWAEFVGNYYGTPMEEVEKLRNEGKNVLLEIEVQGATQVREKCPDALTIFIIPPNMEELEKRIRGRRSEPEEIVQQRLAKASKEMKMMDNYKYIVCNDDPKLAADLISSIIKRHMETEE
jgi:guanylate kinase